MWIQSIAIERYGGKVQTMTVKNPTQVCYNIEQRCLADQRWTQKCATTKAHLSKGLRRTFDTKVKVRRRQPWTATRVWPIRRVTCTIRRQLQDFERKVKGNTKKVAMISFTTNRKVLFRSSTTNRPTPVRTIRWHPELVCSAYFSFPSSFCSACSFGFWFTIDESTSIITIEFVRISASTKTHFRRAAKTNCFTGNHIDHQSGIWSIFVNRKS